MAIGPSRQSRHAARTWRAVVWSTHAGDFILSLEDDIICRMTTLLIKEFITNNAGPGRAYPVRLKITFGPSRRFETHLASSTLRSKVVVDQQQ